MKTIKRLRLVVFILWMISLAFAVALSPYYFVANNPTEADLQYMQTDLRALSPSLQDLGASCLLATAGLFPFWVILLFMRKEAEN